MLPVCDGLIAGVSGLSLAMPIAFLTVPIEVTSE